MKAYKTPKNQPPICFQIQTTGQQKELLLRVLHLINNIMHGKIQVARKNEEMTEYYKKKLEIWSIDIAVKLQQSNFKEQK